jgi:ABC-type transporter Mla MlaB component
VTAPEAFTIGPQMRGRVHRITVAGDIDLRAATALRGDFRRLAATSSQLIELDLRGSERIDPAGVEFVGYMRRHVGQHDCARLPVRRSHASSTSLSTRSAIDMYPHLHSSPHERAPPTGT